MSFPAAMFALAATRSCWCLSSNTRHTAGGSFAQVSGRWSATYLSIARLAPPSDLPWYLTVLIRAIAGRNRSLRGQKVSQISAGDIAIGLNVSIGPFRACSQYLSASVFMFGSIGWFASPMIVAAGRGVNVCPAATLYGRVA